MNRLKLVESRNQREGRYRSPLNKDKTAPQYQEFKRERKRGLNSRRITAQFFDNGEFYEAMNGRGGVYQYGKGVHAFAQRVLDGINAEHGES